MAVWSEKIGLPANSRFLANRKGTRMANLIDFILKLFRDPDEAQRFVADPDQALQDAGLPNVSAAQIHAVAETAAPNLALGNDDPVAALQRAVADHHSIDTPFAMQRVIAPETKTDLLSSDGRALTPETRLDGPVDLGNTNVEGGGVVLGNDRVNEDFELGDDAGVDAVPELGDDDTVDEPAELSDDVDVNDNDSAGLSFAVGEPAELSDDNVRTLVPEEDIYTTDPAVDYSEPLPTDIATASDVGIF